MANFEGYFIQATRTGEKFPLRYINETSYKSTPNQREEIKAYRNENTRDLTRVTASGKKTKIEFATREGLHLADKKAVQKFFTDGESDAAQRKINLKYWNDESNEYKTSDFYRPDIEFTIKKATDNDLVYNPLTIKLVEY